MRRLLVLRPESGASATVARARALGLDAVAIPLFEIEPIAWNPPDPAMFDALLLTSANAVRQAGAALETLRGLPVHAVGDATAASARAGGLNVASIGVGGGKELLGSLSPGLRLLHLTGEDRIEPATGRHNITPVTVYRARAVARDLGEEAGSVALVHSPRAGRHFAELVRDRSSIAIAAISSAAADAVGNGWEGVEAAERPDDDALLALAARLCNKSPSQ